MHMPRFGACMFCTGNSFGFSAVFSGCWSALMAARVIRGCCSTWITVAWPPCLRHHTLAPPNMLSPKSFFFPSLSITPPLHISPSPTVEWLKTRCLFIWAEVVGNVRVWARTQRQLAEISSHLVPRGSRCRTGQWVGQRVDGVTWFRFFSIMWSSFRPSQTLNLVINVLKNFHFLIVQADVQSYQTFSYVHFFCFGSHNNVQLKYR